MPPVIQVEHLSKHYRLGLIGGGTLREDLHRWWAKARGRPDPLLKIGQEDHGNREGGELWALRDVSFQVQEGEILGIIGRNGAGKSTLLKILSRITAPTTGQVKIRGRVGSLLEVGTGFHPELTGRENIYLNGAILGMKKAEINRKLDEIIDFAEIEQFIDTPVKRYSSGMYVRLAFAVVAHLEPEILVVDEVLAVGDTQFQNKCLGKVGQIGQEGRTVLFVSHNMGTLSQICKRGIFLDSGARQFDGSIDECIKKYLSTTRQSKLYIARGKVPQGHFKLLIKSLSISNAGTQDGSVIDNRYPTTLTILVDVLIPGSSYAIAVELMTGTGTVVLSTSTLDLRPKKDLGNFKTAGQYQAKVKLPTEWLLAGQYFIRVASTIPAVEILDIFPEELSFVLHDNTSPVAVLGEGRRGVIAPRLEWSVDCNGIGSGIA